MPGPTKRLSPIYGQFSALIRDAGNVPAESWIARSHSLNHAIVTLLAEAKSDDELRGLREFAQQVRAGIVVG